MTNPSTGLLFQLAVSPARPADRSFLKLAADFPIARTLQDSASVNHSSDRSRRDLLPCPRIAGQGCRKRRSTHRLLEAGQFLVDEELRVTGVVDWDGLHVGHPFLDLDFGLGGYRICSRERYWAELRRRIWEAYKSERSATLPEWRCVNLFWCLIDATTLQGSGCADARWSKSLADLSKATGDLL